MLGCVAGHVVEQVPRPLRIDFTLYVARSLSRGSSISAAENITTECLQLVDGTLVEQDASRTVEFDFNNGNRNVTSLSVTLLYLLTIQNSTNVPKIGTCVHASGDSFPTGDFALLPESQTAARGSQLHVMRQLSSLLMMVLSGVPLSTQLADTNSRMWHLYRPQTGSGSPVQA
ncbi:uncharacterized protein N7529_003562 [Penicillium soppii]|uniref:uncharacterized protein n=1 Tax=Penicillium soppii TaxID=69789 RepID=UPI0025489848|nr:uncharacterized protein N7529_003562 [Penicillium soppii]KAJ5871209.1 hypothetical protein N7529_003562 [Penicillium soppii]